jgi:hypothetical protein
MSQVAFRMAPPTRYSSRPQWPLEKTQAIACLLQALQPCAAHSWVEEFIHNMFQDECVVSAYFTPKSITADALSSIQDGLDASSQVNLLPWAAAASAGLQAKAMQIQSEERVLTQLAAFVYPCGLFYLSNMAAVLGTGPRVPAIPHSNAIRGMLLEDAVHKLKCRHDALGNTMAAVVGMPHGDDVNMDQVTRIAAAVYLANLKINAMWTELKSRAGINR